MRMGAPVNALEVDVRNLVKVAGVGAIASDSTVQSIAMVLGVAWGLETSTSFAARTPWVGIASIQTRWTIAIGAIKNATVVRQRSHPPPPPLHRPPLPQQRRRGMKWLRLTMFGNARWTNGWMHASWTWRWLESKYNDWTVVSGNGTFPASQAAAAAQANHSPSADSFTTASGMGLQVPKTIGVGLQV